jgi:hypothetical protein
MSTQTRSIVGPSPSSVDFCSCVLWVTTSSVTSMVQPQLAALPVTRAVAVAQSKCTASAQAERPALAWVRQAAT